MYQNTFSECGNGSEEEGRRRTGGRSHILLQEQCLSLGQVLYCADHVARVNLVKENGGRVEESRRTMEDRRM